MIILFWSKPYVTVFALRVMWSGDTFAIRMKLKRNIERTVTKKKKTVHIS